MSNATEIERGKMEYYSSLRWLFIMKTTLHILSLANSTPHQS